MLGARPACRRGGDSATSVDLKELHAKIDSSPWRMIFAGALTKAAAERKAMIDRNHALPITRQAELVGISRQRVLPAARRVRADLRLMKRIDALNLAHPFAGSRMLRDMLNREGFECRRQWPR